MRAETGRLVSQGGKFVLNEDFKLECEGHWEKGEEKGYQGDDFKGETGYSSDSRNKEGED
ncbi:hypothetical protein LguiA_001884 [Lonicera macranthoides]